MKKSSFVTLILGTISGVLFSLGMCMALLPQWDSFAEGVILGSVGAVLALITVFVWRKMTNRAPIKFKAKTFFTVLYIILGALVFGAGLCICLVWNSFIVGTLVGLVGMIMLISLIPIIKGIK